MLLFQGGFLHDLGLFRLIAGILIVAIPRSGILPWGQSTPPDFLQECAIPRHICPARDNFSVETPLLRD